MFLIQKLLFSCILGFSLVRADPTPVASPVPSPSPLASVAPEPVVAVPPAMSPLSTPGTYLGIRQGLVFPNQDFVIRYGVGVFMERETQRAGRGAKIFGLGITTGGQDLATGQGYSETWIAADARFELGNRFFLGARTGIVFKTITNPANPADIIPLESSSTTSHFMLGPTLTYEATIPWPGQWDGFLKALTQSTKIGGELSAYAITGQPVITAFQTLVYIRFKIGGRRNTY